MLRAARPATTTPGRSRDRRFRSDWVDGVFPASCAPLPPDLTDEEWALLQRAPGPFVARGSRERPVSVRTCLQRSIRLPPTSVSRRGWAPAWLSPWLPRHCLPRLEPRVFADFNAARAGAWQPVATPTPRQAGFAGAREDPAISTAGCPAPFRALVCCRR